MKAMKKIVLAFDGSTHALNAVNEAEKLMQGFPDSSVTILEVLDIAKAKDQVLDLSEDYEERKAVRIEEVKQQLIGLLDIFEILRFSMNNIGSDKGFSFSHSLLHERLNLMVVQHR